MMKKSILKMLIFYKRRSYKKQQEGMKNRMKLNFLLNSVNIFQNSGIYFEFIEVSITYSPNLKVCTT